MTAEEETCPHAYRGQQCTLPKGHDESIAHLSKDGLQWVVCRYPLEYISMGLKLGADDEQVEQGAVRNELQALEGHRPGISLAGADVGEEEADQAATRPSTGEGGPSG